jgi:opacity protein-like surface antigen
MDLTALTLSLALGYNTYTGEDVRVDSPAAFAVRVGHEELPVYLWGSYDNNETGFLGQPFANNDVMGFGIGAKHWVANRLYIFGEIGYASVDTSTRLRIQQEVVYTEIVRNHNVYQRPVPVDLTGPYDQASYTTEYEIDDGYMTRVGLGWELNDNLGVSVAYRYFRPDTYYNIVDTDWQERTGSDGYWEENSTTNLDAFEIGVQWTW